MLRAFFQTRLPKYLLFWAIACPLEAQNILFVNQAATGTQDGASWVNAFQDIQPAIDAAPPGAQIWVAKGVYRPTQTHGGSSDRFKSFYISKELALYGGFAGTEAELQQASPADNPTILSADLDQNDLNADGNAIAESPADIVGENAFHILRVDQSSPATRLEGFVFTGGLANSSFHSAGAALYHVVTADSIQSELTVIQCLFLGNSALLSGGALYNATSMGTANLRIEQCSFIGNASGSVGGALANLGDNFGHTAVTLDNCLFSGNHAGNSGGALFCGSSFNSTVDPVLLNCIFAQNTAEQSGGAVFWGSNNISTIEPELFNCVFRSNAVSGSAGHGGAVYQFGAYLSIFRSTFINCTFFGNSVASDAADNGKAVFDESTENSFVQVQLFNSIFWGNPGNGTVLATPGAACLLNYSLLESVACPPGCTCGNNMKYGLDPRFTEPVAGNLRLDAGSPAIDVGNNALLSLGIVSVDVEGNPRIFNASGLPEATVDLGAYEYPLTLGLSKQQVNPQMRLAVIPNPVVEKATLELESERAAGVRVQVFSIAGRLMPEVVFQVVAGQNKLTLPVQSLPAGAYRLCVIHPGHAPESVFFLKTAH